MIETIKYFILGLVQGFTEPLPISSSGHLVLFEEMLSLTINDLNFAIIVNAGSLLAILIFYRTRLIELIGDSFSYIFKKNESGKDSFFYLLLVGIATIPAGIIGFIFKDQIESIKSVLVVGIALLFTSLALFSINQAGKENTEEEITIKDSITMGIGQIFALMPGISRSGSTTVAGLSRGINIEKTLEFSFFMYIPISLASLVLGIYDISQSSSISISNYAVGFVASAVSTYIAINFLLNVVKKGKMNYFAIYCLIVGLGAITWSLF